MPRSRALPKIGFGISPCSNSRNGQEDPHASQVHYQLAGNRAFHPLKAARAAATGLILWSHAAVAADKVTFMTSWFAEAEHGGFYEAQATKLYEKAGLDVTIKMGGPQVNTLAITASGRRPTS